MIFKPQHLRPLKNLKPPIELFYNCLSNSNSLLGFKNCFQDWVLNFWPFCKIISHNVTSSLRIPALSKKIKIQLKSFCLILCQILIKVLLSPIPLLLRIMLSLPINRQIMLPKSLQTSSGRSLI